MIKSKKTIIKKSLCMILAILIAIMIMPDIDLKVKAAGSITVDLSAKTATGSCADDEELKLYPYQLFGLTSDDYDSYGSFTYGFTQPANTDGKIYSYIDINNDDNNVPAANGVYTSYMTTDNTDYMTFKASESGTYTFHAECLDTNDFSTFNTCEITITVGASTPKYTVSFDSNGGSAVSDKTDITSGSVITAPTPAPTKSGYAFGGWYKDDNTFLDDWDFANDTVTANTTLHAKWTDNTAPTVVSITRADTSPTKATSVSYTVTFSEDVTGVDRYGFNAIYVGISYTSWTVTGSGKTYTVTINGISGSGTFQLFSAEVGTGIKDLAGNDVIGEYIGEIYTIDTIPPLITGVENNQTYTSEVTPACSESGIVVSLLKNGSEVSGYNFEKISTNGDYTLSVTDSVGNVSTINFTVDIPETYTVSFNTDGGSTAPGNQTINYNNYANIPADPTKTGCDFLGWYNGSTKWNFATDKVTGNITLTAHWKNAQYTVSFNTDGGSIAPGNQTIDYNSYANIPADPTKTGCDFLGWYNGSTKWNFATDKVTSNISLTAHWKIQQFIVSFNTDGGSTAPGNQIINYNSYANIPSDPTKTGCDFLGWYNGSTKWNFATDKVTGNITLTAHWKNAQYTVSFNTDGGSIAPENQTIDYNSYANIPADPTKTGCDFLGWYNGSTKWNFATDKVTSNISLTAHWKIQQFIVSFNTDGGSTAPGNQTINYNNYANIPSDPTKTGCDFLGWYNGSTKWNFATDKVTGNITLTAHWKNAQYTVSFNTDGGSIAPENQTIDYNSYANVPADPTKTGCDFLGWYNGSTKWNFSTDKVTSNISLTAHWKIQKTITIIEAPAEIKNPDLISVAPQGEAFDHPVEVRMKNDPAVKQAITKAIDDKITSEIKDITVFPLDISLYIKGTDTKVQPNSGTSVVITCPIPENLIANKDKIKVVCLIDGKLTIIDTKIVLVNGVYCAQFKATHFSPYAMVVDTANELSNTTNPQTSGNDTVATFSIIAILSVVTLAVVRKKYKFKFVK